jgi:hypothetical protein
MVYKNVAKIALPTILGLGASAHTPQLYETMLKLPVNLWRKERILKFWNR